MMKVLYIPNWNLARKIKKSGQTIHVTIECEYGKNILNGKFLTMAHHIKEYQNMPAVCEQKIDLVLPDKLVIGVSHLDWDVMGALLELYNRKPNVPDFWEAVAYIDDHGPHHLYKFPTDIKEKMNAYWCWTTRNGHLPCHQKEVIDITSIVETHMNAVERIINGDRELLEAGKVWERQLNRRVEKCLVKENEDIRIFVSNNVKCTSAYYSHNLKKVVPFIVEYNTSTKRVRMSTSKQGFDVVGFMVDFFGEQAGGKEGIACSPKNEEIEWDRWIDFLEKVENMFLKVV